MRNDGLYEMKLNERAWLQRKSPTSHEGGDGGEELKAKLKGELVEELQMEAVSMVAAAAKVDIETLHRRLGRVGMERIKELVQEPYGAMEIVAAEGVKDRQWLPTKAFAADMTPHEAFYGRKPNMGFVRVWGCMARYREPTGLNHKILPRNKWGINLGTCKVRKGWVIKDVETGKIVVTRDVIFYEDVNYLEWKGVNKEIATGAAAVLDKVEGLLEEKEEKRVEGDAAVVEEDGHQVVASGEMDTEEGAKEVELRESEEGSAKHDEHYPWRLIDSDAIIDAAKEIEDLLEDGALVIGKE
ncbi:unnamed protein product [Closterium sp. NIES-54]